MKRLNSKWKVVIGVLAMILITTGTLTAWDRYTTYTTGQTAVFTPNITDVGKDALFRFVNRSDEATAIMEVDQEGTNWGTGHAGFAQVSARAQSELRSADGTKVVESSDMRGGFRVTAGSYGYTDDPRVGHCDDNHCPSTAEFFSWGSLALRSDAHRPMYAVVANRIAWTLEANDTGDGPPVIMRLPDLKAPAGTRKPICIGDTGVIGWC